MTTEEAKRHSLYNVFTSVIGAEETETLMAYLPTQPHQVLATKADLDELATRTDVVSVEHRLGRVEDRIDSVEARIDVLHIEMGAFRSELSGRIDSVNRRLDRLFLTLAAGLLAVVGTVLVQAFQ